MSIKYFPNRIYKKNDAAIDRVIAKRRPQLIRGSANVTATGVDAVISANGDWQLNSIKFSFSNAAPKTYSVAVQGGVKVLENLNDYLWFQTSNALWQKITLSPGFYTGTQLAAELESKLNANADFSAAGTTFTVAYSAITGLFTITPTGATLRYIQTNTSQTLSRCDSIAGHLFGLNVTTAFGATVVSDTPVFGLNDEAWVISETNSLVTEHYNDDIHILDLDQALHITTNAASMIVGYEVCYEEIV